MIVHLHASCWNEERMLPFFFRHYDPIVDHYYIHDNQSTDGSLEILRDHPRVTVLPLVLQGDSICHASFKLVNDLWKCSRNQADWVAVCNIDEFFWHEDLRDYLSQCREQGITYLPTTGYDMITDEFPQPHDNLAHTYRKGARRESLDKPSFFNPDAIRHSGFAMARHKARPRGRVRKPRRQEVLLLHYKHLGFEYVQKRHAALHARMRQKDREDRLGYHYDPDLTRQLYFDRHARAQPVIPRTCSTGPVQRDNWCQRKLKSLLETLRLRAGEPV